jgi:NAD(P)H-dependent FMN reductase
MRVRLCAGLFFMIWGYVTLDSGECYSVHCFVWPDFDVNIGYFTSKIVISMLNLKIIIGSTRPGRKGEPVANWFYDIAKQHTEFSSELLDLAKINLPFLDEPEHPRFKRYQHQHTKDWSALIEPADAIVLVTPEYNYGYPAPVKNALDFIYQEWNYKPIGFVSYGGIAAGTRSAQMLKQVANALQMVTMADNVNIPFIAKKVDEQGKFINDEITDKSANSMLKELYKLAVVLKQTREQKS